MTRHSPISPATAHPLPTVQAEPESPPPPALLADEALVPVAGRQDGWTPERQRAFIEMLADTGCVTTAAQSVGMSPSSAYRLRRRTDARAFDAAWDAALERSLERLIPTAIERALHGSIRKRWYHGEVIAEEHVVSERLLIWLLEKGAAMLGHSRARQAMREDWDSALEGVGLEESTAPEPAPAPAAAPPLRVWVEEFGEDEEEVWLTNAPPEPGYEEWTRGEPGRPGFARYLQPEEKEALERKRRRPRVSPWQDESRRRFFGLERLMVYEPDPAGPRDWPACLAAQGPAADRASPAAAAGPGRK